MHGRPEPARLQPGQKCRPCSGPEAGKRGRQRRDFREGAAGRDCRKRKYRMKQEEDDEKNGRKEETDQADDVATLYSWANLHGAKYRDFSASRQEARAQLRQRTMDDRARQAREETRGDTSRRDEENDLWETLLPGVKLTRSEPARPEASRGIERSPERGPERGAERPMERGAERNSERIMERISERAAERAPEWLMERPAELPIERALERLGRAVEATMPPQAGAGRTPETPAVRTLPPAREEEIAKDRGGGQGRERALCRAGRRPGAPSMAGRVGTGSAGGSRAGDPAGATGAGGVAVVCAARALRTECGGSAAEAAGRSGAGAGGVFAGRRSGQDERGGERGPGAGGARGKRAAGGYVVRLGCCRFISGRGRSSRTCCGPSAGARATRRCIC